jgi:hypothetical protein
MRLVRRANKSAQFYEMLVCVSDFTTVEHLGHESKPMRVFSGTFRVFGAFLIPGLPAFKRTGHLRA